MQLAFAAIPLVAIAGLAAARPVDRAGAASFNVIETRPILDSADPACRPSAVGLLVATFLDAFNRGDTGRLAELVAPDGSGRLDFKWFSSAEADGEPTRPPQRHVALYSRADFLAYVVERHKQGEHLDLIFMRSSTPQSSGREVGVEYVVRRQAADLPDGLGGLQRVATGKGAFDCSRGRMVVWSMAMHMAARGASTPTTYNGPLCPVPSAWRYADSPPVVCWHGPNAPAALRSFRAFSNIRSFQMRCSPAYVVRRVRAMLTEFNFGSGQQVASAFSPTALLRARRDGRAVLRGRQQIASFVRSRYMAGEGWTAVTILPRSIQRTGATYQLTVRITYQGNIRGKRQVSLSLDCRSGLVTRWAEIA